MGCATDNVIVVSDGKANVVILTDSQYAIADRKAKTMQRIVQSCKTCSVLDYVDSPMAESSTRMPQVAVSLKQRFGSKLDWILAVNDLYFDFDAPALSSAGVWLGGPPWFVSAGDGSVSAYNRIRNGEYQVATIPEPLNLHGWQIVDELNRAIAGRPPSAYVTAAHVVTKRTIASDGGPGNIFDPDNGYRDKYITFDRCKQRVFVAFCIEIDARFLFKRFDNYIISLDAKHRLRYPDYAP